MTNAGRALLLLELAGVIEVDDAAGITPSVEDITDNPKTLKLLKLTQLRYVHLLMLT